MGNQKPSIPKGTRDFSPQEMIGRNYIFQTIRGVFERYGYLPIETPAMEKLSTLMGKYGEEGDRLLFKILNSGNYLSGTDLANIDPEKLSTLTSQISEKGLRYDLTVPFARYVVQHRNEITFPFKRYQVQPVWRADKPQKGRYREFYQCDVDVIGSTSLLNEVELLQIINDVFSKLKVKAVIKLNNRKILAGIAEYLGAVDRFTDITIALDKLDKIGREKVNEELRIKGLDEAAIENLNPILELKGTASEKLDFLNKILESSETGMKGVGEMAAVFSYVEELGLNSLVELDLSLARGLNYYTGAIIEVTAADVEIGSICGGGRYDDLTGIFGLPDVSGVGISFGADRIYDVMESLNLFPEEKRESTRVMFVNFGEQEEKYCLGLAKKLRGNNINCEVFPERAKMKKQMKYADAKNIPFVVLIGENEMQSGLLTVKNMQSGEQLEASVDELIRILGM